MLCVECEAVYEEGHLALLFADGRKVPFLAGSTRVSALNTGWEVDHVYSGFAPIHLVELVHTSGDRATWFLSDEGLSWGTGWPAYRRN